MDVVVLAHEQRVRLDGDLDHTDIVAARLAHLPRSLSTSHARLSGSSHLELGAVRRKPEPGVAPLTASRKSTGNV